MNNVNMKYIYILIFVNLFLSSCVTNRTTAYLQDTKGEKYEKDNNVEYLIKVNDEINLMIYSLNKEASQIFISTSQIGAQLSTYLVYNDGTIDMPFIRKIHIEGMTIPEATEVIQSRLKSYIPDVVVRIGLAKKSFYIIGDANSKGEYLFYKNRLTIFEALASAGGVNLDANRGKVKIIREVAGENKIIDFDLRSKSIVDSEYYYLQPNDIIYLSRSKKSFYKVTSFASFLGIISSSLTFVLLVSTYSN